MIFKIGGLAERIPEMNTGFKNKALNTALAAAATGVIFGGPVHAATVVAPITALQTESGQEFNLSLTDLLPSDGNGGTLTITAHGDYEDDELAKRQNETLSLALEGTVIAPILGSFNSSAPGAGAVGPFDYFTQIRANLEVEFQRTFTLTGAFLDSLLADGTVNIFLDLGDDVNIIDSNSKVDIVLTYNDTAGIAPVPLPASALLLLSGLAGFGLMHRRKAS